MQTYQQTFAGAKTWELNVPGKYFVLISCSLTVNVRFYKSGKQLDLGTISGTLSGVEAQLGSIDNPDFAFDKVQVDVQAGDTVNLGIGNGQVRYSRTASSATIVNVNSAFTHTAPAMGAASAQILAANANRRYLMIQNNDPAIPLFVRLDGAAATGVAPDLKIPPGAYLDLGGGFACTGQIFGICPGGANANVSVVEG